MSRSTRSKTISLSPMRARTISKGKNKEVEEVTQYHAMKMAKKKVEYTQQTKKLDIYNTISSRRTSDKLTPGQPTRNSNDNFHLYQYAHRTTTYTDLLPKRDYKPNLKNVKSLYN